MTYKYRPDEGLDFLEDVPSGHLEGLVALLTEGQERRAHEQRKATGATTRTITSTGGKSPPKSRPLEAIRFRICTEVRARSTARSSTTCATG